MSKYPFMESALFIEATVMPVTSLLRSTKERNLLYLAEVFQRVRVRVFGIYETAL